MQCQTKPNLESQAKFQKLFFETFPEPLHDIFSRIQCLHPIDGGYVFIYRAKRGLLVKTKGPHETLDAQNGFIVVHAVLCKWTSSKLLDSAYTP